MGDTASVQRSFRLSRSTAERLDAAARATGESRNSLTDRLLDEALRIENHPLVRFQSGAAHRREPMLVGTRLRVRDVVVSLREHGKDVDATADYLGLDNRVVMAALAYYADHAEEIEADTAWAEQIASEEYARWERQRAALA